MSKIKKDIAKLKNVDVYSLMLFVLFKIKDVPEYSTLSELAYILDKENLLKLFEYFGGLTIKIPTIDELEGIIYAMVLYQYVNIDGMDYNAAVKLIGHNSDELRKVKTNYNKICEVLEKFDFIKGQ